MLQIALNIRYFCVTIHHWNGSHILLNSILFYGSLNIIVHKKATHTNLAHTRLHQHNSTELWKQRQKTEEDRRSSTAQCTSSFWFLSELVDFIVDYTYRLTSFSFFLWFSEMFAWALCNANPFRMYCRYPISHGFVCICDVKEMEGVFL